MSGTGLRAVVVVPARDEADRIARCLEALFAQEGVTRSSFEVVVVLHRCEDDTASVVAGFAARPAGPALTTVTWLDGGVGAARRAGMDLAAQKLLGAGAPDGLVATTDADTVVAPDWLAQQLRLVDAGALAVGGLIELDADAAHLPSSALDERRSRATVRMAAVASGAGGTGAEHHFFSGASMALTATTYARVGGLPPVDALEDEALADALAAAGTPIVRSAAVRVTTSARRRGRAPRGLAVDLAVSSWRASRTFAVAQLPSPADLARRRTQTVSVVFPARQESATIATVVGAARSLVDVGLVDEVLVIDAASPDGTADLAALAGATVHQQDDLMPGWGPCLGKGDAMWRSLAVARGDIVCFLDADTTDFTPSFVTGVVAPLLEDASLVMSKGTFLRPFLVGEVALPREGGRVTELAARPALNLWFPELAGFDQPLAGEVAMRREVMAGLAVPVGYGVEIAMLIDVWRSHGLDALCQVDLGTRQNRHQPLRELSAMAYAVTAAAAARAGLPGPAAGPLLLPSCEPNGPSELRRVPLEERPPFAEVAGATLRRGA